MITKVVSIGDCYTKVYTKRSDLFSGVSMGCLKGKSEVNKKGASFACGKCGALVNKKGHACKPVKFAASKKKSIECKVQTKEKM